MRLDEILTLLETMVLEHSLTDREVWEAFGMVVAALGYLEPQDKAMRLAECVLKLPQYLTRNRTGPSKNGGWDS